MLFSLVAIGVSTSYAETITNSTETKDITLVPFDWNGKVCGFIDNGNFVCEWDPNRLDITDVIVNGTETIPDPKQASTTQCPDRFTLQEDNVTCLPTVCKDGYHLDTLFYCVADNEPIKVDKDPLVEFFERKLSEYEKIPPTTWSELDEKWKLENLSKCWYGLQQSRGIQTEDSFVTSTWFTGPSTPKSTDASIIDRAMDICRAETTFLTLVGDHREVGDVRSRQGWFGDIALTHAEVGVKPSDPIYSQDWVNQNQNQNIESNSFSIVEDICGGYYGYIWKMTFQECRDIQDSNVLKTPMINPDRFETTQSDNEDLWKNYLENGDEQQTKQIKASIRAELSDRLRDNSNLFVPTGPSITEQIRAIEDQGWSLYPKADRPLECLDGTIKSIGVQGIEYLEYLKVCGQ